MSISSDFTIEQSMGALTLEPTTQVQKEADQRQRDWASLPSEILVNIFDRLNSQNVGECREVCSSWKASAEVVRTEKLGPPDLTESHNQLEMTIHWLKMGDYVVLHNKNGRFFHKCVTGLTNEQVTKYLNNTRVIYLNAAAWPGLLDDGEWNWYIKKAGFDECTCQAKNITSIPGNVKHKYMLGL